MMKGPWVVLLLSLSLPARADRGRIAPHIIDQIRQDRDRQDQPAQIPLYDELPPPDWRPPDRAPSDEPLPELDRSERADEEAKRGPVVISNGGDDEEHPAEPVRAVAGKTKDGKLTHAAVDAAHKAIQTGDARDLDAIFGENRFGAVDALAFVASGMEQTLKHLDNATVLAEERMVDLPKPIDSKNPNARLFHPGVQRAMLLRPDAIPAAARLGIQSLVDIRRKAVNDPASLPPKLLADIFAKMTMESLQRSLAEWSDIPADTARYVIQAIDTLSQRGRTDLSELSLLFREAK